MYSSMAKIMHILFFSIAMHKHAWRLLLFAVMHCAIQNSTMHGVNVHCNTEIKSLPKALSFLDSLFHHRSSHGMNHSADFL